MPQYRVYVIEATGKRALHVLDFEAASNEAAETFARERQMADTLEVWRDRRRIARLMPIGR